MGRLLLFIFLIGLIFSGITFFIAKLEKDRFLPKYIPSILLFLAGAFFLVKARWFSEGMQDLGNIVFAMLSFGGCIISLSTAIFINLFKKSRK